MKPVQITEAELEVMKLLWDHSPQSAPELAAKLAERRQWAATTVKTLIARLAKKQALEQSYRGRVSFCRPLIGREEYTSRRAIVSCRVSSAEPGRDDLLFRRKAETLR